MSALRDNRHHHDRQNAVQHLLKPRIDVNQHGEHADERSSDDRTGRRVDPADQDHDQNVERDRPTELAWGHDSKEAEQPAREADRRRGEREYKNLHRPGANAGSLGERFRVPDRKEHRIKKRTPNAPDHKDHNHERQHHPPGDRRSERRKNLWEVGEVGPEQALHSIRDLKVGRQHRDDQSENECRDGEMQSAHPKRSGAENDSEQSGGDDNDRNEQE